jgi:tetratricopeptide (TPR) repeat protein
MTVDWRQSSWLEPSDALDDAQRARHEAALRVLDAYRLSGTPFLLFLRTFHVRQLYGHASEGGDGGDGILLEVHFQRELAQLGANILRVQDVGSRTGAAVDGLFGNVTPALAMRHETWLDAVKELMTSAELLVSEVQFTSPGVINELRACVESGKLDQTVLILPSPPFAFVGNHDAIAEFPRVIHQHDMNFARPADSFVFRDLIARIGRIAMLNDAERTGLIRENKLRAMLPVSYDGVPEGMFELAKRYAEKKSLGAIVFYGNRAALARKAKKDYAGAINVKLAVARLCEKASDLMLALVLVNDAEASISAEREGLDNDTSAGLLNSTREFRSKLLGEIFEGLMSIERAAELWQLAKSQAGFAIARGDKKALGQCLSWMSVAALLMENFELALEQANDAIAVARASNDVYREAFASFYLGNAYKGLGQLPEAEKAFLNAVRLFPCDRSGRIYAAAMLSLALTMEQLHPSPPTSLRSFNRPRRWPRRWPTATSCKPPTPDSSG